MSYLNSYLEYVEGLGYRDNWDEVRTNICNLIDAELTPEAAKIAKAKLTREIALNLIEVHLVEGYEANPLPNEVYSIRLDSEVETDADEIEDFSSYRYIATLDVTLI